MITGAREILWVIYKLIRKIYSAKELVIYMLIILGKQVLRNLAEL